MIQQPQELISSVDQLTNQVDQLTNQDIHIFDTVYEWVGVFSVKFATSLLALLAVG